MPPSANTVPKPEEVIPQLEHMLASGRFVNAPNQADFLRLVVRRALKGRDTSGQIIAKTLFADKFANGVSTDVRVTAANLRTTLRKYYAAEGNEDAVIISLPDPPKDRSVKLPEGKAYTPSFSYNPNHAAGKSLRLGQQYLRRRSPMELVEALDEFEKTARSSAGRADGWTGLAESACLLVTYHTSPSIRKKSLQTAVAAGAKAVQLAPDYWRAYAATGAALLCSHDMANASKAFSRAQELEAENTRQYGWYIPFLISVGKHAEALEIARRQSEDRIEDPLAQATYGFYLYLFRQFEAAKSILEQALKLDRNDWFALLAMSLVCYALDDPDQALKHYDRIQFLLDYQEADWILPGLASLYAHAAKTAPSERINVVLQWVPFLMKELSSEINWFQVAIAAVGEEEPEVAVESLRRAWKREDPLVWWVHLWPVFDSLRTRQDFQSFLAELNLTAAPG